MMSEFLSLLFSLLQTWAHITFTISSSAVLHPFEIPESTLKKLESERAQMLFILLQQQLTLPLHYNSPVCMISKVPNVFYDNDTKWIPNQATILLIKNIDCLNITG